MRWIGAAWSLIIIVCLWTDMISAGEKLSPPTNLPPLQESWKEDVYAFLTRNAKEKNKMNVRYLFLDPPVPCTTRFTRKSLLSFGFGSVELQGYGGVVLRKGIETAFIRKRKSIQKDADVLLYVIIPETGKIEVYTLQQMEHGKVVPPLVTLETEYTNNGRTISLRAKMSPQATVLSSAFRAIKDIETFDQWPPYK